MNSLEQAQHIAQLHSSLQIGNPPDLADVQRGVQTDDSFATSLMAARLLGFLENDAQCVAQAWAAKTKRTGVFDPSAWPEEPADFGLTTEPSAKAFASCPQALGLYAVLPDAAWVARMVALGVPTVQLRFKSDDAAAVQREVNAAVQAVQGSQSLLFINDHWQAAIEAGAYGVHLGQEDMQDAPLERIRARGLRLGLSSHGYVEMQRAAQHEPSYIALGAVFPTTLKRMETAPQGLGRLNKYARLMRHRSLVAIGGIDLAAMPSVLQSGVGSVAVVRAITGAEDVAASVRQLLACMQAK
jgi:thiamine-phosphate pyrophosphorylase